MIELRYVWGMSSSSPTGSSPRSDYHDLVRDDVIPSVPRAGGALLELGGGIGATAVTLKKRAYVERVGVVDLVGESHQLRELDFSYSGDLNDESFLHDVCSREGPFDLILCLDILEHLIDPWRVVRELHSSLKAGGFIVASIPNVRNFRAVLPLLLLNRWTLTDEGILDRTHLRFFVRSTAIQLMTSSGLRLESVTALPTDHWAIRLFRKLTLGLLNTFTDRNYIIVVRKTD